MYFGNVRVRGCLGTPCILSSQFFCEFKTVPKNKVYLKKNADPGWSHWGRGPGSCGFPGLEASQVALVVKKKWKRKSLSRVPLFATLWSVVHGILQARILEWVAFPFSRRSPQPRIETRSSKLPAKPQGKPKNIGRGSVFLLQWIFPAQELNRGLLHWQPTPVFSPGKSHGRRSLVG